MVKCKLINVPLFCFIFSFQKIHNNGKNIIAQQNKVVTFISENVRMLRKNGRKGAQTHTYQPEDCLEVIKNIFPNIYFMMMKTICMSVIRFK